jgi:hypothetical protein
MDLPNELVRKLCMKGLAAPNAVWKLPHSVPKILDSEVAKI